MDRLRGDRIPPTKRPRAWGGTYCRSAPVRINGIDVMLSKRKREDTSDEVKGKRLNALSKAVNELSEEDEGSIASEGQGDEEDDLSSFIDDDSEGRVESSDDAEYVEGEETQGGEDSSPSCSGEEEEEEGVLSDLEVPKEPLPVTRGRRNVKPIVRYQDPHYNERMFGDVPEEEVGAILDEADPYFEQKFRGDLSESEEEGEGEEGQSDGEKGYDTDDYEERDNAELRMVKKHPPCVNILDDEDLQDTNEFTSAGPIGQFLTKKQPKEVPTTGVSKITLKDAMAMKPKPPSGDKVTQDQGAQGTLKWALSGLAKKQSNT